MSSTPKGLTNTPIYKNPTLISIAEGNGSFNNIHLAALVLGVPWFVKRMLPLVNRGGFKTYLFLVLVLGVPVTIAYWTLMSMYGPRKNEKVALPGKDIEEYITIHDPELKAKYHGKEKIPMQIMHDAYFDGKIDFNGAFSLLVLVVLVGVGGRFDARASVRYFSGYAVFNSRVNQRVHPLFQFLLEKRV